LGHAGIVRWAITFINSFDNWNGKRGRW